MVLDLLLPTTQLSILYQIDACVHNHLERMYFIHYYSPRWRNLSYSYLPRLNYWKSAELKSKRIEADQLALDMLRERLLLEEQVSAVGDKVSGSSANATSPYWEIGTL